MLGALGALVAALLTVVATPQQASALPPVCSSGGPNVTVWTGGASTLNWDTAANWTNGVPDASDAIACVPSGKAVSRGRPWGRDRQPAVHRHQLTRRPRCGEGHLLRRRHDSRRTRGPGRFDVHGQVDFSAAPSSRPGPRWPSGLAATPGSSPTPSSPPTGHGTTIDAGGTLELAGSGGYTRARPWRGNRSAG